MIWKSFLFPQTIYKCTSAFSGVIEVRESFGRLSLRVNSVTQSGDIVEDIYRKIFPLPSNLEIKKVLILGLGVGSFYKLLSKQYTKLDTLALEVDKTIIDVGKKYFPNNNLSAIKIINTDAIIFVEKNSDTTPYHRKFDLVFVDLYRGEERDKRVEGLAFIKKLACIVCEKGVVIFNLINFRKYKSQNKEFIKNLRLFFGEITTKKAYSNLIVYCTK